MCSKDFIIDFTEIIKPQIEVLQPSFFEITVAMAFEYFARNKVDVAVIETGLGRKTGQHQYYTFPNFQS